MARGYFSPGEEDFDLSPPISDEVQRTNCFMCSGRCGIRVHLLDGGIRHVEGDPDHPVNGGRLCAKGAAAVMQHYSPARLTQPLKRIGERGNGQFEKITWDEALETATGWLGAIRDDDPRKLAFFTGRDQSRALTGWWASRFGTPNYGFHGGMCATSLEAAGAYTMGGGFRESGVPDWERARYLLMFGVAEDHDGNGIKAGLAAMREQGARMVAVNPVRTGYAAIADEWVGIRPGSDGALIFALVHELLKAGCVDLDSLVRDTNLPWLVIQDEGGNEDGLFARNIDGAPLCWDSATRQTASALLAGVTPALAGSFRLEDGKDAVPAFELMAKRYLDPAYGPETAAEATGVPAVTIRRIAAELAEAAFSHELVLDVPWTDWAGRRHETMTGRPVALMAMRGIAAHDNGFQTGRALHLLQILLGTIDSPGGFLYRAPFPKAAPPPQLPAGTSRPGQPLDGPALGFPTGPEDLLVDDQGGPLRMDKAFSWTAPLAVHGMMQMVIANAWASDPYPIDTLLLHATNLAWNGVMNTDTTMAMLADEKRIPHIICSDAYYSETAAFADLILPDCTFLERWDCLSLLDQPLAGVDGPTDGVRQPVLEPQGEARPFQDVLLELGAKLGLLGLVASDGRPAYPGGYADYMVNHERSPGIGLLAGWRGTNGEQHGAGRPNPDQLDKYVENGGVWHYELPPEQRYFRHANRDYLDYAAAMGFTPTADQIILQVYLEPLQKFRLAARGHGPIQPPDADRARVEAHCDPLPFWRAPAAGDVGETNPHGFHAVSQRPPAQHISEGAHNAWLRQITPANIIHVNRARAKTLDIEDGDQVWISGAHGRVRAEARLMEGVQADTAWCWNAMGHRSGAWNLAPESAEATGGFLLNQLMGESLSPDSASAQFPNADPVTGQAAWYDLRVCIEKISEEDMEAEGTGEAFQALPTPPGLPERPDVLRYGRMYSHAARREKEREDGDGR